MSGSAGRGSLRRKALGAAITAVVMAAAVAAALRGGRRLEPEERSDPAGVVLAVIQAAIRGDVPAYLECFTGDLRKQLEARAASSRPAERFAESLRASVADLKGSATSDFRTTGADEAMVTWERVHARYTERYRVRLRRASRRWKIAALDRIERGEPDIPYGTPVFPDAPESSTRAR